MEHKVEKEKKIKTQIVCLGLTRPKTDYDNGVIQIHKYIHMFWSI